MKLMENKSQNFWKISRSFEFDYSHRVWAQQLTEEFSCDTEHKCRHIHGHHGVVTVTLHADKLDQSGMVTDFKHLNWFKQFLDNKLDHKHIVDINDISTKETFPLMTNVRKNDMGHYDFDTLELTTSWQKEVYDGLVVIDFVPTSENFSKWLWEVVVEKMKSFTNIKYIEISFSETPKSIATYGGPSKSVEHINS